MNKSDLEKENKVLKRDLELKNKRISKALDILNDKRNEGSVLGDYGWEYFFERTAKKEVVSVLEGASRMFG